MTLRLRRPGFARDTRGNIAVMTALVTLPIVCAMGMAVDYNMAGRRQAKLNAIADATALTTTTPAAMAQSWTTAKTNAQNFCNAEAALVTGTSNVSCVLSGGDRSSATATVTRTATVNWTANSTNAFARMIGMSAIPIGGTRAATNSVAPNIDFYLLIDTSPSMAIAATTAGINTMVSHTASQGGCAFACHQSNPAADNLGNPGGEDNYALARQLGVTLRIDLVRNAVSSMISAAQSTETSNHAAYRVATYTFDATFNTITNLTASLSQAQSDANNIQMLQVYKNGCLTSSTCNNDEDTAYDAAMANSQYMPAPGNGTNNSGDKPQEVLFIVTDGVSDENINNNRFMNTVNGYSDWCTPLKNRNIRIAFLYLTYNPLPTNSFYNSNIAPFQPNIAPAAQACASPGLYFQVNTDGDISAAMTALFQKVVATAHLTR